MATAIRSDYVYEARLNAVYGPTGKKLSNTLYYKNQIPTGNPYGTPIPGADMETLAGNIVSRWVSEILIFLPPGYGMTDCTLQSVVGKRYATPLLGIAAATSSLTFTSISTSSPHNLRVGDTVEIFGTPTPCGLDGYRVVASVPSIYEFTVTFVMPSPWTGGGQVQLQRGRQTWAYGAKVVHPTSAAGVSVGEDCPLYVNYIVKRNNTGVGRHWRSRLSVAPVLEDNQEDGQIISAIFTSLNTHLATLATPVAAGGGCAMKQVAVSQALGMLLPTPFIQSDTWSADVTSLVVRPNTGSMIRRKSRSTAPINPTP